MFSHGFSQSKAFLYFTKVVLSFPQWVLYLFWKNVLCICNVFEAYCYFKGALALIYLGRTTIISGSHLQWCCHFYETSTSSHPFFQRYWDNLSLSVIAYNSMNGAFCCIRGVAVTHSSIFTVFFQTKSYSEERYDSQQLWYLLGCRDVNIEWCFVIWRHQLQPFIFSIVLPLFHGSIYVKASVSISRLLLQLSILKNGLWLTIHYKKWSVIDHLL